MSFNAEVSWSMTGDALDPGRVSDATGLVPSKSWRTGDLMSGVPRPVTRTTGMWKITSKASSDTARLEVEAALLGLLEKIRPHEAMLGRLAAEMGARRVASIWWEPEVAIADFGVAAAPMAELMAMVDELTVYVVPTELVEAPDSQS